MKFAIQRCCPTSLYLKEYEASTDALLEKLGIGVTDIKEFNCCGYPLRNVNFRGYILSAARNLALAERESMDVLTVCNCCFVSLKYASNFLKTDSSLLDHTNTALVKEGLRYEGKAQTRHLFQLLFHDIGIETLKHKVVKSLEGLKVAAHYGCHLLRPKQIVQVDNPFSPTIFDQLIEVTGASSVPWSTKLECCGSPLWGVNDELALSLTERKLTDAVTSGADCVCVACPFCQLQFDRVQRLTIAERGSDLKIPSLLSTQLLGLSLGIDGQSLGLKTHEFPGLGIERNPGTRVELGADELHQEAS